MNRRKFLTTTGSCGAHVFALATFSPLLTRRAFAADDDKKVVATEKWGRLEKIHDGVWALISTPFDSRDFTTVCNGGIIAGEKGVLVIEAYMQEAGAKWMAERAEALAGRRPTDVVVTHYHGDHTAGHAGFKHNDKHPKMWITRKTQIDAEKSLQERDAGGPAHMHSVSLLKDDKPTEIDLGNRKVKIVPRAGHTASDVTVELTDPNIVWCGDLFFNRMFPNYRDSQPKLLNQYVNELIRGKDTTYVPGHGPIADQAAAKVYKDFLAFVEKSATDAFSAGKTAEDGAKEFKLPDSLKEWVVWSPDVAKNGYAAWYREFQRAGKSDDQR